MKPKTKSGNVIFRQNDLLLNRFVKLVEDNHQVITEMFMNDLLKNPDTIAYRQADVEAVYESSERIYKDLSRWICREFSKDKIAERYKKLGRERFLMGVPFDQVLKGLILQRRHLWLFVMDKLYSDSTVYQEALELNNRVTLYFDRAMFYMLQGFKGVMA